MSGIVSPLANNILLLAAAVSFICGPLIGFFDCYYDMDHHMLFTGLFTNGEVVYVYMIYYCISSNRDKFAPSSYPTMDRMFYMLCVTAVVGAIMHFNDYFPDISVNQIGEWVAFYGDFFLRW